MGCGFSTHSNLPVVQPEMERRTVLSDPTNSIQETDENETRTASSRTNGDAFKFISSQPHNEFLSSTNNPSVLEINCRMSAAKLAPLKSEVFARREISEELIQQWKESGQLADIENCLLSTPASQTRSIQSQLFVAVQQNDTSRLMDIVLSTHCDPRHIQNEQQETLLHVACRLNHDSAIDMVRTLVEIYQCSPLLHDQHSLTAYHHACQSGNLEVLFYLLRIGGYHYITDFQPPSANVLSDKLRCQLLIAAGQSGSIAMTRFAYVLHRQHNAILDDVKLNIFNDTLKLLSKMICSESTSPHSYHYLYRYGAERTSLYEACCTGNLDPLKFFLDELDMASDSTVKSRDQDERLLYTFLLEVAYRLNCSEITEYLTKTKGFCPAQTSSCIRYPDVFQSFDNIQSQQNYCNTHTCSPLQVAILSGNTEVVRSLISQGFHHVRYRMVCSHDTLLHSACVSGKKEMVEIVMHTFKCDINACNNNGDTPLHVASEWGHLDICLYLLEQKECNHNIANNHGHTPLTLAIRHNRLEIFMHLPRNDTDVSVKTNDTLETPMHLACCHACSGFAMALLGDDNNCIHPAINAVDKYGDTAIFNACRVGNVEVVRQLIAIPGCDRSFVNQITKETPAHIACRMKRLNILRALASEGVDYPVKYDQLNCLDKSLLHVACDNDAEDIVNYLIDNKVCENVNMDHNGRTPLHIAYMRGNTNIVKTLLASKRCKITDEDKDENTVLHYICNRDVVDSELIIMLCGVSDNGGSLIEKQNIAKYNPLHYVCENDGIQVLHCLLKYLNPEKINIALHTPNEDGDTPLHLAIKQQRVLTLKFILNCSDLVDGVSKAMCIQNLEGHNVFHYIIKYCKYHYVYDADGTLTVSSKLMIEMFLRTISSTLQEENIVLSLCQRNKEQHTPVQYLVDSAKKWEERDAPELPVLSCLLHSKLSPKSKQIVFSVTTSQGDTLIHLAAQRDRCDIIKVLVEQGPCNPTIFNYKNESPLHVACSNHQGGETVLFLCKSGCNAHQLNKSGHSPLFHALKLDHSLLEQLIQNGHWKPENPVLEVPYKTELPSALAYKQTEHYGIVHSYRRIMTLSESVDDPGYTSIKLPLPHCMLLQPGHSRHTFKTVVDLVIEHNVPNTSDSLGNTLLHLCSPYDFEGGKDLLAKESCDVNKQNKDGNTPLHIACATGNRAMINLLVERCTDSLTMQNIYGHTPLYYTSDRESINCLVINGADPKDVADSERVKHIEEMFKKLKGEHPLTPTVTALVLGNSEAGKTTLIKSLTEAYNWKKVNPSIGQVESKINSKPTAGVEISEYKVCEEDPPRVLFYDFAGQLEFQSTHSTLLQNLLSFSQSSDPSPLLFVIVLDITSSDKLTQLTYWAKFIENCPSTSVKPEVMIIGSHIDQIDNNLDLHKQIKASLTKVMELMKNTVDLVENPLFLDCRQTTSKELQRVKCLLLKSTKSLMERTELDTRSHCLFAYLYEHFPDKPVKLLDLQQSLRKQTLKDHEELPFTQTKLVELLKGMHCRQHILIFGNESSRDFWILTAKAQHLMFKRVIGQLFAKESFEEHVIIESNVGVLSSTLLQSTFPDIDYELLQQFLVYSELCKKIEDQDTLNLLEKNTIDSEQNEVDLLSDHDKGLNNKNQSSRPDKPIIAKFNDNNHEATNLVDYFFFPGLVKETREHLGIWMPSVNYSYTSGWILECKKDNFFNPLFLQVLLLRLTFQFAATSKPEVILHRKCLIWKNGLSWSTQGVEMLVEMMKQNQGVFVCVRCFEDTELEAVKLRSAVLKEINKVKVKHCPKTKVNEFIIFNPTFNKHGSLADPIRKVPIEELVPAIKSGLERVQDSLLQHHLINKDLLCFEPYAGIGNQLLTSFFGTDEAHETVTEDNLSRIPTLLDDVGAKSRHIAHIMHLVNHLNKPIVYHDLRELFDMYSLFHGRDPRVCIHVN